MHFTKTAVPAIAIALSMVQYCPAPFLPALAVLAGMGGVSVSIGGGAAAWIGAIGGVAGAITGGISAGKDSRDLKPKAREFNSRIKRQDIGADLGIGLGTAPTDCKNQLAGATVTFTAPAVGSILVNGIPSACMTLSGVLTGRYNEGNPVPMGVDSILFSNLSNESMQAIQDALNAHPNKKI